MDRAQAIHHFWSSFGLPAYSEDSSYDKAEEPYITYSVVLGDLYQVSNMSASVWYRSYSWEAITKKVEEIERKIETMYPIKTDTGGLYIAKGDPFAQRARDPDDDLIRRYYINIQAIMQ